MALKKSSQRWIRRQCLDPYVKRARQEGLRSRAAFKLLEIQKKEQLFHSGLHLVDLGSSPGAWSQLAARLVGPIGKVFALDILPMPPLEGVEFVQGDISEEKTWKILLSMIESYSISLVTSDIAPNISGIAIMDQPRIFYLAHLALELAQTILKPRGDFLVKVFQGREFEAYLKQLRTLFLSVRILKPKASRADSQEVYLVAKGLRSKLRG